MTFREAARSFDSQAEVVPAAWAYELALVVDPGDVDLRLDLVALYVVTNDPGFAASSGLDTCFVDLAYPRAKDLLQQGISLHGAHPDFRAWMWHADERVLGRPIDDALLGKLAADDRAEFARLLVYVNSGGTEERSSAEASFRWASGGRTARQRYYLSFAPGTGAGDPDEG